MSVRPYCYVCKHHIRGGQAAHNQTKEHRRHAINPRHTTKKELRAQHRRAIRGRKQEDDYASVKAHRRSRPRDGTRRIVKVKHYWRRIGQVYRPYSWQT